MAALLSQIDEFLENYKLVRQCSEQICAPLSDEDCLLQACEDVSPAKWHLAHTTWFFERFLLRGASSDQAPFHPAFDFIFNSYYETSGSFHPRPKRGLLSRPSRAEVLDYRQHVDRQVQSQLFSALKTEAEQLQAFKILEIGLHHEQQHQELMLSDIKFNFFSQPLQPSFAAPRQDLGQSQPEPLAWQRLDEGVYEIGHEGPDFAFDNEKPAHKVYIPAVALACRPLSNREFLAFIEDQGYQRVELWLSEGWHWRQQLGLAHPLYWHFDPKTGWRQFTLYGWEALALDEPVCHISLFEAEAFAHWVGARLPTESEWEVYARSQEPRVKLLGNFLDFSPLHPRPLGPRQVFGDVWEWTSSSYSPYPGYKTWDGTLGEYNGKFMVNQYVLRGGSCVSPPGHLRPSYRNFFPAWARWQFTGMRLAKDL